MTKRPNHINAEVMPLEDIVLTDDLVKKLRASSSMFNKSTYVQIMYNGVKYNVEGVDRQRGGGYRITLISTVALLTLRGEPDSSVSLSGVKSL